MKTLFLLLFTAITAIAAAQTVTDKDGNTYPTVQIGPQTWMAKNLATTGWGYYITYGEPVIYRYSMTFTKDMGFYVRCVKD